MINLRNVKRFCKKFENIENYREAISSPERWDCHHRNEIDMNLSREGLKEQGLYYNRPAVELVFLTHRDHRSLHNKGNKNMYGKHHSTETKKKISESISKNHADFSGSKNPAYKFICPIKLTYMYCKQKMSANAIAKELEISGNAILKHLRELNIPIRKR